ncbi:MAG: hypothetical protein K9M96_10470 [Deltaproteobacteria bacterium]|nr:hypothetical protein [Deltaproteobacteria bacterium]
MACCYMFTSSNCSAPIKVINTHILFPQDWYSYIYPNLWLFGIHCCAVAPLFNLSAYEILNVPLADGDYIFYLVIDDKINDIPNLTWKASVADIPSTIQGVLTARLDRLEKETKRILQEASVIGRAFYYEVLSKITQLIGPVDDSLTDLDNLDLIRID